MELISLFPAKVFVQKLCAENGLKEQLAEIANRIDSALPQVALTQIVLSAAGTDLADKNGDMTYPRVCVFGSSVKNTNIEKFRSFSGAVTLVTEVLASGDLLADVNLWIHCYVEGVTRVLRSSVGDWGSGIYYAGDYEVQFQAPKSGGFGFVQSAKLIFNVGISLT